MAHLTSVIDDRVLEVLRHTWGFASLRPLQEKAIEAALARRDSLVVMPTGGGKSLCYQLPALLTEELTVVVSPLISLMKDQVDTLRELGVDAHHVNSTTSAGDKRELVRLARAGRLRLLFVSPERLAAERFQDFLASLDVRTFAIDEAHCISHWGHDFRPEYRQLGELRERFPNATLHAYTATATPSVRNDIAAQLRLKDPVILLGSFDRANLSYRVLPRLEPLKQTLEIIERHKNEAGIIYCIRKKEVDEMTAALRKRGIDARPYHAGLSRDERTATQEAFAAEECGIVVATVAFGMGIDRSNIRFVLHTGLPKSVEHYQQETGRAGRDGLEADCVLLYSAADALLWRSIIEKSDAEENYIRASLRHVEDIDRYARGAVCRHRALVNYFGEDYATPNCGACDLCLGDVEEVNDAIVIAQKILSCVVRTRQRFGAGHVISVLRGENTDRVRALGHDALSTYGLLSTYSQAELRDWIYQLIGQGVLAQEGDRYPVLCLTEASRGVLRGEESVRLVQIARKERRKKSKATVESWEGVDEALFESLRKFRRELAAARGVPPYIILGDRSLREVARLRPQTLTELRDVYGIGDKKLADLGTKILAVVSGSN
ncbi:MAG TPA: DNA helicase RecQ [Thermoanaerobaculia bacterium]|nr:DNA helicase RecQ [Thermoanaerobaculia bacterium]